MDIERFEALALAYGGDLGRWPEAEQAEAVAFQARSPEAARRRLEAAEKLDFALNSWAPVAPSAALRDKVLASAPRPKPGGLGFGRGLGFWLSGAGFAAAAMAGVVFGFAASSAAVSDTRADTLLSSAFSSDTDPLLTPFTVGTGEARAA